MVLDFDAFAIGLLLTPFAAALLAPTISRETGRAAGWILAVVPAGLFVALASMLPQIAAGHAVGFSVEWVPALDLQLSLRLDGLSLVFALLITGIGAFIAVYSGSYLQGHQHRGRFLAFLMFFMGAMLGLVLADSLVALFAFWELTSVASFLLIGFDSARPAARRGAIQALVVTGIGGLALMAGGVLLALAGGGWNLSAIGSLTASPTYPWIMGFVLVAAFTKSAQVPFHFWLPLAMEAPTPVSAYLHSATMVQAGVYLLARLSPILSGTPLWQVPLLVFGGVTLLWGAIHALGQTDLKYILAQSTIAALGFLVLLVGVGGEAGALAFAAFFIAHALYKATLFLVSGIIEEATRTRDITRLRGLREPLAISFLAAATAALSMFGVPPLLGWFAKEGVYAATIEPFLGPILVVMFVGNVLLGAAALTVLIRPFMGEPAAGGARIKEGGIALWSGPAIFALASFSVVFVVGDYGYGILAPIAGAIVGEPVASHLALSVDPGLPLWLSIATWGLAIVAYSQLGRVRSALVAASVRVGWTFDRGFDQVMFALVRFGGATVRLFHHGRLELYMVVVFGVLAVTLVVPFLPPDTLPAMPAMPNLTPYEWTAIALAAFGVAAVVFSPTRLGAIVALGVHGLGVGLIFMFMGAPDLGFTQLMIEVVSVVILALVMTRLRLSARDPRPLEDWSRDGILALICGVSIAALLLKVVQQMLDLKLPGFFAENSLRLAHGRNIVNVVLVDFRGLDTLGEIAVVATAGVATLILLRRASKTRPRQTKATSG